METQYDWRWSTHQPLHKLLLKEFNPQLIMELGAGLYSTSLFIEHNPQKFICIENDKKWLDLISEQLNPKEEYDMVFNDLGPGIDLGTFRKDITKEKLNEIINYYNTTCKEVTAYDIFPKLLFVDNFTCCRSAAVNVLSKSFDIITYHDCQPAGISWYEYYFDNYLKEEFFHYYMKTSDSWTGVFVNKNLKFNEQELLTKSISFANAYCIENALPSGSVYLKKVKI